MSEETRQAADELAAYAQRIYEENARLRVAIADCARTAIESPGGYLVDRKAWQTLIKVALKDLS